MDNFYVTLISNNTSSPKNQPASFRTYLPYTLQLQGQWECCLAELSFMKSWNNVDDLADEGTFMKQTSFNFWLELGDDNDHNKITGNYDWEITDISSGHYTVIDDLLKNFRTAYEKWVAIFRKKLDDLIIEEETLITQLEGAEYPMKDSDIRAAQITVGRYVGYKRQPLEEAVQIRYDNIRKRVILYVDSELITAWRFSNHLNYILGFKNPEEDGRIAMYPGDSENGEMIADYPINFNAGASSLYVYTDIVQPNIVSNKMAKLLRIVNGTGEYGTYMSKAYTKPYYLPISSNTINSIEIEIKDEMGRNIRFSFGITIALLHFQRKKPFAL